MLSSKDILEITGQNELLEKYPKRQFAIYQMTAAVLKTYLLLIDQPELASLLWDFAERERTESLKIPLIDAIAYHKFSHIRDDLKISIFEKLKEELFFSLLTPNDDFFRSAVDLGVDKDVTKQIVAETHTKILNHVYTVHWGTIRDHYFEALKKLPDYLNRYLETERRI